MPKSMEMYSIWWNLIENFHVELYAELSDFVSCIY
jgi:hypothetical protein